MDFTVSQWRNFANRRERAVSCFEYFSLGCVVRRGACALQNDLDLVQDDMLF